MPLERISASIALHDAAAGRHLPDASSPDAYSPSQPGPSRLPYDNRTTTTPRSEVKTPLLKTFRTASFGHGFNEVGGGWHSAFEQSQKEENAKEGLEPPLSPEERSRLLLSDFGINASPATTGGGGGLPRAASLSVAPVAGGSAPKRSAAGMSRIGRAMLSHALRSSDDPRSSDSSEDDEGGQQQQLSRYRSPRYLNKQRYVEEEEEDDNDRYFRSGPPSPAPEESWGGSGGGGGGGASEVIKTSKSGGERAKARRLDEGGGSGGSRQNFCGDVEQQKRQGGSWDDASASLAQNRKSAIIEHTSEHRTPLGITKRSSAAAGGGRSSSSFTDFPPGSSGGSSGCRTSSGSLNAIGRGGGIGAELGLNAVNFFSPGASSASSVRLIDSPADLDGDSEKKRLGAQNQPAGKPSALQLPVSMRDDEAVTDDDDEDDAVVDPLARFDALRARVARVSSYPSSHRNDVSPKQDLGRAMTTPVVLDATRPRSASSTSNDKPRRGSTFEKLSNGSDSLNRAASVGRAAGIASVGSPRVRQGGIDVRDVLSDPSTPSSDQAKSPDRNVHTGSSNASSSRSLGSPAGFVSKARQPASDISNRSSGGSVNSHLSFASSLETNQSGPSSGASTALTRPASRLSGDAASVSTTSTGIMTPHSLLHALAIRKEPTGEQHAPVAPTTEHRASASGSDVASVETVQVPAEHDSPSSRDEPSPPETVQASSPQQHTSVLSSRLASPATLNNATPTAAPRPIKPLRSDATMMPPSPRSPFARLSSSPSLVETNTAWRPLLPTHRSGALTRPNSPTARSPALRTINGQPPATSAGDSFGEHVQRRHTGVFLSRTRSQMLNDPDMHAAFSTAGGGRAAARARAQQPIDWSNAPFSVLEARAKVMANRSVPPSPGAVYAMSSIVSPGWMQALTSRSSAIPPISLPESAASRTVESAPLVSPPLSPLGSAFQTPQTNFTGFASLGDLMEAEQGGNELEELEFSSPESDGSPLVTAADAARDDASKQAADSGASTATSTGRHVKRPSMISASSGSGTSASQRPMLRTPTTQEWSEFLAQQGVDPSLPRSRTVTGLSAKFARRSDTAGSGKSGGQRDLSMSGFGSDESHDSSDEDGGLLQRLHRHLSSSRIQLRGKPEDAIPGSPTAHDYGRRGSREALAASPNARAEASTISEPGSPGFAAMRASPLRSARSGEQITAGDYPLPVSGLSRSMRDFVVVSEIGRGAYGLVKKVKLRRSDGQPTGKDFVIKLIIKSRILADCWRRHRVLGPIPVEIHVMDQLRRLSYDPPLNPPPWSPQRLFPGTPAMSTTATVVETSGTHPNLAQMLDFFEDHEFYYLVMPCFGKGQDLFDFVESAPDGLDARHVRCICGQVADGLRYLHANNIVHRDIKDENVILDGRGHAQIIDFGSAAHIKPGRLFDTFSGTLDYAAAEILQGEKYSGKPQDIWALGVVLYVMMCGECPFWNGEEAVAGLAEGTRAKTALQERCMLGNLVAQQSSDLSDLPDTDEQLTRRGSSSQARNLADDGQPDGGGKLVDGADLIERCLSLDLADRPTAEQLCTHRFLIGNYGWHGPRGWERLQQE